MSVLWTDVIDPATLSGYVRESLAAYEARKGTLARFLPNREVPSLNVSFRKGSNGLVEEAQFRAYDAEPEIGASPRGQRVILELPAIGQNIPVTEYAQLQLRGASNDSMEAEILRTADKVVQAVADRIERLRGTVLVTGKATINQANFVSDDDFGRDPSLSATAGTLWSAGGSDPLGDLATWVDLYVATNGVEPGAVLMPRRVVRSLTGHASFQTVLAGGGSRNASIDELRSHLAGQGLPDIVVYDRQTSGGRVIPDDRVLLLPAPVGTDESDASELGATFWGQTLTSMDPSWDIADSEQPGLVAGVYRNPKPPMIAEVISDAIALPVLANANLSAAFKAL